MNDKPSRKKSDSDSNPNGVGPEVPPNAPREEQPSPREDKPTDKPDEYSISHILINVDEPFGMSAETLSVPCKRPPNDVWFQVHPDPEYVFPIWAYKPGSRDGIGMYAVAQHIVEQLGNAKAYRLFTTVDRDEEVRLWPIRLYLDGGRKDAWTADAERVVTKLTGQWGRAIAKEIGSGYKVMPCPENADWGDPKWPTESPEELLKKAFPEELYIRNLDHPVARKLLGRD